MAVLLLLLILLVLIYTAYKIAKLNALFPDPDSRLSNISKHLDEIKSDVGGIKSELDTIGENLKSIESAVSASLRHWLDEYALKAESSARPPVRVPPSKSEPGE